MKNTTSSSDSDINGKTTTTQLSNQATDNVSSKSQNKNYEFNETLLESLPYPAMYIRRNDRIVIAANQLAIDLGAKVNEHCWKEFGKSKFIHNSQDKSIITDKYSQNGSPIVKCTFCRGEECIFENPCQHNPRIEAWDRIWDTYWIKVSDDVFLHYLIDITEQISLEDSLKKSEHFLKRTQAIANLGTFEMDLVTLNWKSSDILDKIFGIEKKTYKTFDELIAIVHPTMKQEISDYYYNDVLGKNKRFDKEYRIIRQRDGEPRWIHALGDLKFDDDAKPIKMIGTIQDITEIKHEQNQIIRNLKFTEVLLESVPVPVFFLDTKACYSGCNEAFTKQMGLTSNDINGKTVVDLWPNKLSEELYQKDLKILTDKKIQKAETTVTDKDGNNREVIMIKNVYYDELGEVSGIVGTYVDITEQKEVENFLRASENKYKLLAHNVTDGIFTCFDHYIKFVNLSMCRIFGYDEDELIESKLNELIIPSERSNFDSLINFDSTTNQVINQEIKCIRKDRSVFYGEVILNYVASESIIYGVIQDITKKKQLQDKSIVNAILNTEEKERSSFSKELHDGLGPLLSTIKLYLQWSLRPMTGRSRKKIIKKAEEIVEESLSAVKEISSRLSPHLLTNYGLTSAIQSFIDKVQDTNAIKIDFVTNLNTRIDMEIEVGLYRVIIECLNNTIKYARAKHIHIKINYSVTKIQVQYMDDGKGFDLFKILSEKKGLGLFNIQNRIHNLGGEINMFSERYEGVNYQINIPLIENKVVK